MTYIIRDDNKAFRLNPDAIYDVQFDESKPTLIVTGKQIGRAHV